MHKTKFYVIDYVCNNALKNYCIIIWFWKLQQFLLLFQMICIAFL